MREMTAILRPSFRDIMRRGRRTLSIRITFIKSILRLLKIIEINYKNKIRKYILEVVIQFTYRKNYDDKIHHIPRYS